LFCCLQCKNKPAKVAKGTTIQEFEHNMKNIVQQAAVTWGNGDLKPFFCYDNAKWQAHANFSNMGMSRHQRIVIPPHSPDMNKPIEHVFHQIKQKLAERFYKSTEEITAHTVQEWVRDIFENEITTASIMKDALSLKKTYLAIKTEKGDEVYYDDGSKVVGTGGDYPIADLR
jgi:hypothetical protein